MPTYPLSATGEHLEIYESPRWTFYDHVGYGEEGEDTPFSRAAKKWVGVGEIDSGCDNDHGELWLDTRTNVIHASDGRDETRCAFHVADSIEEVLQGGPRLCSSGGWVH